MLGESLRDGRGSLLTGDVDAAQRLASLLSDQGVNADRVLGLRTQAVQQQRGHRAVQHHLEGKQDVMRYCFLTDI